MGFNSAFKGLNLYEFEYVIFSIAVSCIRILF